MRTNPKTIKLAKIRRLILRICRKYDTLNNLDYPDCYTKTQKEIEKTAIKIYEVINGKR